MTIRIESTSNPGTFHVVELDSGHSGCVLSCTCSGWKYRHWCHHVRQAVRQHAEEQMATLLLQPLCHRLRTIGFKEESEALSVNGLTLRQAEDAWDKLDAIEASLNSLRARGSK